MDQKAKNLIAASLLGVGLWISAAFVAVAALCAYLIPLEKCSPCRGVGQLLDLRCKACGGDGGRSAWDMLTRDNRPGTERAY